MKLSERSLMRKNVFRRGKGLQTAFLLTVFLFAGLGTTSAGATPNGRWWHETIGVAQAHAAGNTGDGVMIAVIDSSINPDLPVLQGADLSVREPSFNGNGEAPATGTALTFATDHGTNVVSQIIGTGANGGPAGVAPDATVRFYSVSTPESQSEFAQLSSVAIVQAVADGADIISISIEDEIDTVEVQTIAWAINRGVVVVVGLGDNGTDLDYRAQVNGVVAVASVDATGNIPPWTVGHKKVSILAPGDGILTQGDLSTGDWSQVAVANGNSYATPIVSGTLALVASKYPDATGNQLIQSLVQNADGHGSYDVDRGYGFINLAGMLENDPTQYPDVNPLVTELSTFPDDLSAMEISEITTPFCDPPDGWADGVSPQVPKSVTADAGRYQDDSTFTEGDFVWGAISLLAILAVAAGIAVGIAVVCIIIFELVKRRKQR